MSTKHPHLPRAERRTPVTTYRLQLTPEFDFAAATKTLDYLADLGITDVYVSPILQAAPGSTHGYDVVDHTHVSTPLGGREGFEAFANRVHELGMYLVVDVVPNHMAVPTPVWHNKPMWSVLKHGPDSAFKHWFDVELDSPILMPILGKRIGQVLSDQELELTQMVIPSEPQYGPQWVLKYYDHVFPVAKGTESLPLAVLVERQHYRLAHWKVSSEELNYRRFFDVGTLAGLRVEREEVFNATHALLIDLFNRGFIDAFRVDHPDGLADPREYFNRLWDATGGAWVVAEKILEGDETLPADWAVAGTTGYDTAWRIHALNVEPRGLMPMGAVMSEIAGDSPSDLKAMTAAAKSQIVDTSLSAEIRRLGSVIWGICQEDVRLRDHTFRGLVDCLRQLVIDMDRYRAYVVPGQNPPQISREVVEHTAAVARKKLDDDLSDTMDVIVALVLGDEVGSAGLIPTDPRRKEVIIRFQQVCGAVQAKGVEDTTFYRWTHLLSLNEVGGAPDVFGLDLDHFHAFCQHLASNWPATMTCGSTHDTKRSEDVRARISVLSQKADEWVAVLTQLRHVSAHFRPARVDGRAENLMWQTIVGTWADTDRITPQRLRQYLIKAIREQKEWTDWTNAHEEREQEFLDFATQIIENEQTVTLLDEWLESTRDVVNNLILVNKAVQLMAPGVADIYQGSEITSTSLVDPDNRRPVDFEALRALDTHADTIDARKLALTTQLVRLRARLQEVFASDRAGYEPLPASSGHCIAFARCLDDEPAVLLLAQRLEVSLTRLGGWQDATVLLPPGRWEPLGGGSVLEGGQTLIRDVLGGEPVAVLVREDLTDEQ
ncbi:malto-oligosyltrehalose synthase [Gleimia hominis]|uniref:Malto-oligosyltrehalose synthase n=1 Tax=Gleimia hominis TaxID=595468 RepID=A0ABU3IE11_9ACTO|nr:malto-oligosyltrehalose synthase [Gleimia hominis]MDT3767722.1 malto-oligosyltrehalose synthase [Gleimia hominis]